MPAIEYRAVQRMARISPRKARLAVDLIRGERVERAMNVLEFDNRRSSFIVRKVLQSAVANAQDRGGVDPMDLRVVRAFVDEAPTIKRWRPSARGRIQPIARRNSHITIVVATD